MEDLIGAKRSKIYQDSMRRILGPSEEEKREEAKKAELAKAEAEAEAAAASAANAGEGQSANDEGRKTEA